MSGDPLTTMIVVRKGTERWVFAWDLDADADLGVASRAWAIGTGFTAPELACLAARMGRYLRAVDRAGRWPRRRPFTIRCWLPDDAAGRWRSASETDGREGFSLTNGRG